MQEHNNKNYKDAFTTRGIPWEKLLLLDKLTSKQAYLIERHIKKMKSKKYIENLIKYPEMIINLIQRYQ